MPSSFVDLWSQWVQIRCCFGSTCKEGKWKLGWYWTETWGKNGSIGLAINKSHTKTKELGRSRCTIFWSRSSFKESSPHIAWPLLGLWRSYCQEPSRYVQRIKKSFRIRIVQHKVIVQPHERNIQFAINWAFLPSWGTAQGQFDVDIFLRNWWLVDFCWKRCQK